MAKAANQVAEANGASGPVAANDNSAATAANDIIVTASRYPKDPGDFLGTVMTRLFQKFLGADLWQRTLASPGRPIEGAAYGQMAGGLVLGSSGSKTGAAIGGALGNIAGKALGKAVGGTFGKALGPLGSIAGGILGSAFGRPLQEGEIRHRSYRCECWRESLDHRLWRQFRRCDQGIHKSR